jgi:hypothetical protein
MMLGIEPEGLVRAQTHQPATWVALTDGICRAGRTGAVEVKSCPRAARVFFLSGRVVAARAMGVGDALVEGLIRRGVATAERIEEARRADPDGRVDDALVAAGIVDGQDLARGNEERVVRALGAPLGWPDGKWAWEERPGVTEARFDPDLLPEVDLHGALWSGVQRHLPMADLLGVVTDPAAGEVVGRPGLTSTLDALTLGAPLDQLAPLLDGATATIKSLLKKVDDRGGQLVQLLWLLEALGVLRRAKRDGLGDPDPLGLGRGKGDSVQALIDSGAFDEALPVLLGRRRAALEPGELAALGWVLWRLRDRVGDEHGDPVGALKDAFARDPQNPQALEYLARIAGESSDAAQARRYLSHLRMVRPDHPWVVEALARASAEDFDPGFWSGEARHG